MNIKERLQKTIESGETLGADFRYKDLSDMNFKDCSLNGIDFRGANLSNCTFENCNLSSCQLDYALMIGVTMQNVKGDYIEMRHANLSYSILKNVSINYGMMQKAKFTDCEFHHLNIDNTNVNLSSFSSTNLSIKFSDCIGYPIKTVLDKPK